MTVALPWLLLNCAQSQRCFEVLRVQHLEQEISQELFCPIGDRIWHRSSCCQTLLAIFHYCTPSMHRTTLLSDHMEEGGAEPELLHLHGRVSGTRVNHPH